MDCTLCSSAASCSMATSNLSSSGAVHTVLCFFKLTLCCLERALVRAPFTSIMENLLSYCCASFSLRWYSSKAIFCLASFKSESKSKLTTDLTPSSSSALVLHFGRSIGSKRRSSHFAQELGIGLVPICHKVMYRHNSDLKSPSKLTQELG